jgi:hypothetical protein
MAQDEFADNVFVPPKEDNYDEYVLPEGDYIERAQTATHLSRVKDASLRELLSQFHAKRREIDFAIEELKEQLAA